MRSSRLLGTTGPVVRPSTALLRIEFTAPFRLRTVGELLPRLSTLTCPKAGGISLLHLSWGHPRRALPVILALWSPDFPHLGPFGSHPRLSSLRCGIILTQSGRIVKSPCKIFWKRVYLHHGTMEPLNKSSAAEQRIFFAHSSVPKTGNTYSIPPLSISRLVEKSLAVSSCRLNQSFLRVILQIII